MSLTYPRFTRWAGPRDWAGGLVRLIVLCLAISSRAEDRVLVLNSDRSVEKYRLAERAFLETWKGASVEMDLGNTTGTDAGLRNKLRDASPSAIYCIGSKAYMSAIRTWKREPIVLSSAINWERLPERGDSFVIANELPVENQATLFRYFFPGTKRIGVLCSHRFNKQWIEHAVREAKGAGVEIVYRYVDRPWRGPGQLRKLLPEVDALWIVADPIVLASAEHIEEIFRLARDVKKPVFAYSRAFAELGATLMVSPDDETIGRQAAGLLATKEAADRAESSVQHPAGSEVILNLRVVEEYGLDLNDRALDSVNRVIR